MKSLILFPAVFIASLSFANCISQGEEGFAVSGRESASQTYECSNFQYPYFNQINYTVGQGLNCSNEAWPSRVVMNCENRSHREREVRNPVLLCCANPAQ